MLDPTSTAVPRSTRLAASRFVSSLSPPTFRLSCWRHGKTWIQYSHDWRSLRFLGCLRLSDHGFQRQRASESVEELPPLHFDPSHGSGRGPPKYQLSALVASHCCIAIAGLRRELLRSKRGMPAAVVARQLNHQDRTMGSRRVRLRATDSQPVPPTKRLDLEPDIHQTDRARAQHFGPRQKTGPRCNGRGLIKPSPGR